METQYFKHYSPALGKDMECTVYGHAGRPVLFIPCQDGHHGDFAGFNEVYAKYFISKPARSCVAVKTLPKNVLCEIEAIAAK